eukprot:gene1200-724_t
MGNRQAAIRRTLVTSCGRSSGSSQAAAAADSAAPNATNNVSGSGNVSSANNKMDAQNASAAAAQRSATRAVFYGRGCKQKSGAANLNAGTAPFLPPTNRNKANSKAKTAMGNNANGLGFRQKQPPLLELQPGYFDSLPGPSNNVHVVSLLGSLPLSQHLASSRLRLDLRRLASDLRSKNCDCIIHEHYLAITSSEYFGQSNCHAFFFKNGSCVFWRMSHSTQRKFISIARDHWRAPGLNNFEDSDPLPPGEDPLRSSTNESVEVWDSMNRNITHYDRGCLYLSTGVYRYSDMFACSIALAAALRLNLVEHRIERGLAQLRQALYLLSENTKSFSFSSKNCTRTIFESERHLHELRYDLNVSDGDSSYLSDLLWEHETLESINEQLQGHFDIKRRTEILNHQLTYALDHLQTLGEFARQSHSNNLEVWIIVLIALEIVLETCDNDTVKGFLRRQGVFDLFFYVFGFGVFDFAAGGSRDEENDDIDILIPQQDGASGDSQQSDQWQRQPAAF